MEGQTNPNDESFSKSLALNSKLRCFLISPIWQKNETSMSLKGSKAIDFIAIFLFVDRTEYYTTAKNLLVSGADAMERLMTAYKEIVELAGYTARVAIMIQVFEDCSESKYQR